jgi:hypothetical protein
LLCAPQAAVTMKKPAPEDGERMRRTAEESLAARENMQRILDGIATRQRDRDERERFGFWGRLLRSRRIA